MPPTPKWWNSPIPIGCLALLGLVSLALAVGGIISGNGAVGGLGFGGLIATAWLIVCVIVSALIRHFLKPATEKEERAFFEAIVDPVFSVLGLYLLVAVFLATEFAGGNIREAVLKGADQDPAVFWITIAVGGTLGLISSYRIIRAGVQRVSSESAAPVHPAIGAPPEGGSDKADVT